MKKSYLIYKVYSLFPKLKRLHLLAIIVGGERRRVLNIGSALFIGLIF